MAGLIDVGILKPELAGSFAAGYRGAEQARQQAAQSALQRQQAEQQLARGRQQMQMDDMTMKRLQEDRAAMVQLQEQLKAAGKDPDLDKVFDALIATGNPDYVMKGMDGKQRLREQKEFARAQGFDLPSAAPVAAAPAAAAPVNALMAGPDQSQAEVNRLMRTAPPVAAAPAAPAAPAGASAAGATPELIAQTQGRINNLMRFAATASPQMANNALAQARILQDQLELYSKPGPATPTAPAEVATMQALGFPLTPQGYAQYKQANRPPPQPAAPREPPAPTVTQIQDPADPNRMLTIDARRYAGGSVGAPGVIGTSGKTAPAAAAEQKKVAAQNELQNVIDTLKTAYADLDAMRAVPSEQRNVISNALSYIASTGPGQVAGRIGGTQAQTQRDIIQSSRNLLFTAVKNATGKTSGELNSNVEFKTWLEALTDPSRSIQANQAILENLEKFVASGGNYSAKKGGGEVKPAPGAPPRAPAAGASPYQNLSNEELLRQLGVKPGGR